MRKLFLLFTVFVFSLTAFQLSAAEILVQDKDSKSGVGYTAIADESTLTLAFDFSGPIRLMQMARNGFKVYINPNGKKKTTIGLAVEGVKPPHRDPSNQNAPKPQEPKSDKMQFTSALWFDGSDTTRINLEGGKSFGFKAYLDRIDDKNRCIVVIPLQNIDLNGKKLKDMMIGLLSEPIEKGRMPSAPQGDDNQRPANFPEGERPEGGMHGPPPGGRGGMRGPGGPGRGPGMGGNSTFQGNASTNKIDMWFKCK